MEVYIYIFLKNGDDPKDSQHKAKSSPFIQ